jgi:hypothetical protein
MRSGRFVSRIALPSASQRRSAAKCRKTWHLGGYSVLFREVALVAAQ